MENNKYITKQEAAKRLQVTPSTIARYCKKGLIGHSTIAQKTYVLIKDVEEFWDRHFKPKKELARNKNLKISREEYLRSKEIVDTYIKQIEIELNVLSSVDDIDKNKRNDDILKRNEGFLIRDVSMSKRTFNGLYEVFGYNGKLADIAQYTETDILKFRNIGDDCVFELKTILNKHGLKFSEE